MLTLIEWNGKPDYLVLKSFSRGIMAIECQFKNLEKSTEIPTFVLDKKKNYEQLAGV